MLSSNILEIKVFLSVIIKFILIINIIGGNTTGKTTNSIILKRMGYESNVTLSHYIHSR